MIEVTIEREANRGHITSFTLLGHADFAEHGKDIVCAGVSAVAFGTVNAVEALLGIELPCETDEETGHFAAVIPPIESASLQDQVQLLLEAMVVMLDTIQQSYGKYITIKQRR